ncbi:hypothetical protein [Chryseobacterium gossypii]|uniref:hypothetical protein n=1 Tax=Chryseobacterium gossypii TaxID=3231602 RepID=UPI0035240629
MKTQILSISMWLFAFVLCSGQTGNVGIGTTDPKRTLDVNGNLRVRTIANKKDSINTYNRVLIGNSAGNIDYIPLDAFNVTQPNVKTIKFASGSFPLVENSSTTTYTPPVTIGNLSVRYKAYEECSPVPFGGCWFSGKLEFRYNRNNGMGSRWVSSTTGSGSGGSINSYNSGTVLGVTPQQINDTYGWNEINYEYANGNNDITTTTLNLFTTNEVYRISFIVYENQDADGGTNTPAVPGTVTIFVERLTND